MPRIVGDAPGYTFHLKQVNGRYSQDATIWLPSVTTIIKRVLAAPALIPWAYRQTIDSVSGLVSTFPSELILDEDGLTPWDFLIDAELLDEVMAGNRMRPEDIAKEAAGEGSEGHEFLAALADLSTGSEILAERMLVHPEASGHKRAIASWWLERKPEVVASEQVVYSLEPYGGYAGSLDLVYGDSGRYGATLTDLKCRGEGRIAYVSDEVQVGAYETAWIKMGNPPVSRRTILVVRDDATWDEYVAETPPEVFIHLLAIDNILRAYGKRL